MGPTTDVAVSAPLGQGGRELTGVVLDTNVVLDWLVFADAATRPLATALGAGRLRWWLCPAILAEVDAVLAQAIDPRWESSRKQALTRWWTAMATPCPDPAATAAPALRCRDASDQKFVDLALAQRAVVLLTRDRALLALARAAARHGLMITQPARWQPPR